MVYGTKFARALDDSPKVRLYLLYLIIALSCGVLFTMIFPIVATEEELGDGNPKEMYSIFSRMFWMEFGDVLDFGNNIVVKVHIYVSLVGFTSLVKTETPFSKQDEYQFAKWSDCHPDNHTEIITTTGAGRRLLNMDMGLGSSDMDSQEYSYDVHRMLATATIGDNICTGVSEDCLHSSEATEGLIVFCLLLALAGMALGAMRVYQIESKNWHQLSVIVWFCCFLAAIVSLGGYNRDCIQSIVTVLQENRDKYPQATSSPTDSLGNIAKALVAVICLGVILCVGHIAVFPARADSNRLMESQAERARSNSAARAASTISRSNPMQQQVAPKAPPPRTAGGAINDPNNEL
jgi:hypothetical protein